MESSQKPGLRTKKITLMDVANAAGVSRTTASSILRHTGGTFSAETVERVFEASRQLGFRPNAIARWLRTGQPRLLGFISPVDLESAHHLVKHQIEVGIALECRQQNMDIVKVLLDTNGDQEINRVAEMLDSGLLECLVLENPASGSQIIPLLLSKNVAFTVVGNPEQTDVVSIDNDNVALGREITSHFLELGHTNLVYIAPAETWAWGRDRIKGFHEACDAKGIAAENRLVINTQHSMQGGYAAMQQILAMELSFTGIIAADDQTAYGVIQAITESGKSIPEDFSVAGCNNDHVFGVYPDLLTSIELNSVNLGILAAKIALDASAEKDVPKRTYAPFTLIPRRSTAAPVSS